jgi:hypothetical protein
MCTVLLPPGVNPIAVKYISYHIISYKTLRRKSSRLESLGIPLRELQTLTSVSGAAEEYYRKSRSCDIWCQIPDLKLRVSSTKQGCWRLDGDIRNKRRVRIQLPSSSSSSSSSCSWRIRRVSCFLILKIKLVPPSLPRPSSVPSSFWFIF